MLKYGIIRETQLIYSLIIIRLATCFDPAGSSSGLHCEPIDIRKLRTFLGSQRMFTKDKYDRLVSIGHELQPRCIPAILVILDHSLVFRLIIPEVVLIKLSS
jgi:hypothetical protein